MKRYLLLPFILAALLSSPPFHTAQAQDDSATDLPDSIAKYYPILLKSPSRTYLYDRFLDAWLESRPLSELPEFFKSQAERADSAAADHLLAGYYFAKNGDNPSALKFFESALERDPENGDARLARARIQARQLDFSAAVEELDLALESASLDDKQALEIGKLKGSYLTRNGESEAAREVWSELLSAHPEDLLLHEDIVETLASEGEFEAAIESATDLVEKTTDPYDSVVRQLRIAELYQLNEDTDAAIEAYESTLPKTGTGTWLEREIINRVSTLFRRGDDLSGLADWLSDQYQDQPQRLLLLQAEAVVAAENGEPDRAIKIFQTILEKSPGDQLIQDSYVTLLFDVGEIDQAIEQQQILINLDPEESTAYLRLAELQFKAGKREAAGESLLSALKNSSQGEIDYLNITRLLERYAQRKLTEETYAEALKTHPESAELSEAEAAFYLRDGREEEALARYRVLGESATTDQLIRIARNLLMFNLGSEAHDILTKRTKDLGDDFAFLEAYIQLSSRLKQRDELKTLTLRHLGLADTPDKLERALQLATTAFSSADERKAILEPLEKKADPLPVEVALIAQLKSREGNNDEAIALLKEKAESATGETRQLFLSQQVLIHRRTKDWDEAATVTEALYNEPGGRTSRNVGDLVSILTQGNRQEEALQRVEEWKKLSPGSILPWLREAELLMSIGKTDDAIAALQRASSEFSGEKEIQIRLANLHSESGNVSEATRIHWKLYEDTPESTLKLRRVENLYEIASYQGAVSELIEEFDNRRKTNQTSIDPLLALAKIHELDKATDKQEEALKSALRVQPDNLALIQELSRVQIENGNWEASIATLTTGAKLDQTTRTQQMIARIHIENGDPQKGYEILTQVASEQADADTSLADLVDEIADIMIGNGDYEVAIQYLENYFTTFPDNYRLRYLKAVALEELGETEAAIDAFVELLFWDEEMSSPLIDSLPKKSQDYFQRRNEYMGEAPDSVTFWREADINTMSAYAHREDSRFKVGLQGTKVAERIVSPVLRQSDLTPFALAHLREMADLLEDEKKAALIQRLSDAGVPEVEIYLGLRPEQRSFMARVPASLLKEHPDNVGLHFYWTLNAPYLGIDSELKAEDILHTFNLLKDPHPNEALATAILGHKNFPENKAVQQALKFSLSHYPEGIAAENKIITAVLYHAGVIPFNSQRSSGSDSSHLSEDLLPLVTRLVREGYDFDYYSSQLATLLFDYHLRNGDYGTINQLFEQLIETPPKNDLNLNELIANHYYRETQFSYSASEAFPTAVLRYLQLSGHSNQPGPNIPVQIPDNEDFEALLELAKDPLLKLLLMRRLPDKEATDQHVESLRESEDLSTDAQLFIASWFEERGEWEKAIHHLAIGSQGVTRSHLSNLIDNAIIQAAIKIGPNEDIAKEEGRKAIIRLTASITNENYFPALAAVMNRFGMMSEARKLSRRTNQRSIASRTMGNTQRSTVQKLKELVTNGKKDAAAAFAAQQLQKIGREAVKDRYGNWRNQFWELRELVGDSNIGADALALVASRNGETNPDRLHETGIVAELFQMSNKALPFYEKAIAIKPNHFKARSRLVWLKAETKGAEAALSYITDIPTEQLPALMNEVRSDIYGIGYDRPSDKASISMIGVVQKALHTLPRNTPAKDLSWFDQFATYVIGSHDWGGIEMGHLHDLSPIFTDRLRSSYRGSSLKADTNRVKVYDALCETSKEFPSLSRATFITRCAFEIQRGTDPKEWETRALDVINFAKENSNTSHTSLNLNLRYQSVIHPIFTPEEFLIHLAWTEKNPDKVSELTEDSKYLQAFKSLYFIPKDQFQQAADSFLNDGASQGNHLGSAVDPFLHVIWAMKARSVHLDVAKALLDKRMENKIGSRFGSPSWHRTFVMAASEMEGFTGYDDLLRHYRDLWLGEDLEEVRKRVKEAYASQGTQLSTSSDEGSFVYRCIAPLAADETILFPAIEVLRESGFDLQRLFYGNYRYRSSDYFTVPENIKAFFSHAPWFDAIGDIDFAEDSNFSRGSLGAEFFYNATNNRVPKPVLREILNQHPDSFFTQFTLALIDQSGNQREQAVLAAIGDHYDEFSSLPDDQTKQWMNQLTKLGFATGLNSPADDDQSPKALATRWMIEQGAKTIKSEMASFVAANQVSDTGLEPKEFESLMNNIALRLLKDDPGKAAEMFHHGWKLIHKQQLNGGWRGTTSYNGWTVASELLDNFCENYNGDLKDTAMFLEIQKRDTDGQFPHSGWTTDHGFANSFFAVIERNGGTRNASKSVPALLNELHQTIATENTAEDHRYSAILNLPFFELAKKFPPTDRLKLIEAADAVSQSGKPEAYLGQHLAMASRFFMASADPNLVSDAARAKVPDPDLWMAHGLEILSDDSLQGSFRVPLANYYSNNGIRVISDEMALLSGDIVATAFEKQHAFNGWNLLHCLRAFCARQGHDDWEAIANRIEAGWWKKNRHNGDSRYTGRAFDPLSNVVMAMLELSVRKGDKSSFMRYQREFTIMGKSLYSRVPMILIAHNQWDTARELLTKHHQGFDASLYSNEHRYYNPRFTPEFSELADAFLETMEKPEEREFARAFLYAAPDPQPRDTAHLKGQFRNRHNRLMGLTQSFNKTAWSNDELRRKALQQILIEPFTAQNLAKLLAKEYEAVPTNKVLESGNTSLISYGMRIQAAHCWNEIRKGNFTPLEETYQAITDSGVSKSQANEARESLARYLSSNMQKRALKMSSEELSHLVKACQVFLADYSQSDTHFTDHDLLSSTWIIAASLSGQTEQTLEWIKNLPAEQQTNLADSMSGHHNGVWQFLSQSLKVRTLKDSAPKEIRQQVTVDYFGNPITHGAFATAKQMSDRLFQEIVKRKLLSNEELLEVGEAMHQAWPRNGRSAYELSLIATELGETDLALFWGEKTLEELREKSPMKLRLESAILHAENLQASGKSDRAQEVISNLPQEPDKNGQGVLYRRLQDLRTKL